MSGKLKSPVIHITAFLYVLYIPAIIWQILCTYARSLLGGLYAVMTINTLLLVSSTLQTIHSQGLAIVTWLQLIVLMQAKNTPP